MVELGYYRHFFVELQIKIARSQYFMTTEVQPDRPQSSPNDTSPSTEPTFGWTAYAEQINGRFAMVGFVFLLCLEFFTHQDIFTWLGLRS
jgi:hypothetical protein